MKFVDVELEEPITGEQVQVKSDATMADFRELYFVVHNSKEKWPGASKYKNME